jgi:hypothetical protein
MRFFRECLLIWYAKLSQNMVRAFQTPIIILRVYCSFQLCYANSLTLKIRVQTKKFTFVPKPAIA